MDETKPTHKTRVYIAGPYSKGDVAVNVRSALAIAERLVDLGYSPYVPHLTHFWHLTFPRPYAFWLEHDMEWLRVCDAVFRIPGDSSGADGEVREAELLGIPVFYDMDALMRALPKSK